MAVLLTPLNSTPVDTDFCFASCLRREYLSLTDPLEFGDVIYHIMAASP